MSFLEVDGIEELKYNLLMKDKFLNMVQTMMDVAEIIRANTFMRVPLDTGRLEESFHYTLLESNSDYIVVEIIFDAEDPETGEHYAMVQHETTDFIHPRRGEAFYLMNGIQASIPMIRSVIETDYLSLFS